MKDNLNKFTLILDKIAEVHRSLLWKTAKLHQVSPSQIQILLFLYSRENMDTSIKIIATYFNLKAPTISESIKSLTEKKFIRMHVCGSDKRIHCYKLTKSGKKIVQDIHMWNEPLIQIYNEFDKKNKTVFLDLLHHFVYRLESKELISGLFYCSNCKYYDPDRCLCAHSNLSFINSPPPIHCQNFIDKQN